MPKRRDPKKSEMVHQVVAQLFAKRGYHSTSIREIARQLGMNQSSLYYYFSSKEEILFRLMNEAMDDAMTTLKQICESEISPEEKLSRVLGFYVRYFAGDQDRLTLLVNERDCLGETYRRILIEKERRYVQLFKDIFEELNQTKKAKTIPPQVATFAFFGMVHYTIKWYHRDGPVGLDQLADFFVEMFTCGILRSGTD
jgi:AcrR family transcriptional regulator